MVPYSNNIRILDKLVRFSNSQLALPMYCSLKTGRVFEWLKQDGRFYHLINRHKLCPENDHLNTGLIGFQMMTVHIFTLTVKKKYYLKYYFPALHNKGWQEGGSSVAELVNMLFLVIAGHRGPQFESWFGRGKVLQPTFCLFPYWLAI
jgi:hypothetical protein